MKKLTKLSNFQRVKVISLFLSKLMMMITGNQMRISLFNCMMLTEEKIFQVGTPEPESQSLMMISQDKFALKNQKLFPLLLLMVLQIL